LSASPGASLIEEALSPVNDAPAEACVSAVVPVPALLPELPALPLMAPPDTVADVLSVAPLLPALAAIPDPEMFMDPPPVAFELSSAGICTISCPSASEDGSSFELPKKGSAHPASSINCMLRKTAINLFILPSCKTLHFMEIMDNLKGF
jgi:hypothetical protein